MLYFWQRIFYLILIGQIYRVNSRGQRIDIFSQSGSDMVQVRTAARSKNVMFNALPRNSPLRWTKTRDSRGNYVIPYTISGSYDPQERSIITDAMGRIEANTCIRFSKRIFEKDYIDLQNKQNEGCYTNVGRLSGKNVVMLEANDMATCVEADIVIHELMHAIGLWHEHMRYDRDNYINVHFENIDPIYIGQFEKISASESTTYDVPYDYKSVMHYAESAFAMRGKISMETKDPRYQKVIGNQKDASPSDYKKICIMYGCSMCMGTFFDPENPNNQQPATVPPPQPPPVNPVVPYGGGGLQPITYPPGKGDTNKNEELPNGEECNEVFSSFCQRMAYRHRLDCRYFSQFCSCTCQRSFQPPPPLTTPSPSRGFFDRFLDFFKRN